MRRTSRKHYRELRTACEAVMSFIGSEYPNQSFQFNSKIANELGFWGDDNCDLLDKFTERSQLDCSGFNYAEHFHSEAELFGSRASFITLLSLILWVPATLIRLISFGKLRLDISRFDYEQRPVLDLSIKDLITWHIEGQYCLASQVRYQLIT